jgi:hypothetical protein
MTVGFITKRGEFMRMAEVGLWCRAAVGAAREAIIRRSSRQEYATIPSEGTPGVGRSYQDSVFYGGKSDHRSAASLRK